MLGGLLWCLGEELLGHSTQSTVDPHFGYSLSHDGALSGLWGGVYRNFPLRGLYKAMLMTLSKTHPLPFFRKVSTSSEILVIASVTWVLLSSSTLRICGHLLVK